jgi:hypothetical protein
MIHNVRPIAISPQDSYRIFSPLECIPLSRSKIATKYRHLEIIILPGHPLTVSTFIWSLLMSVVRRVEVYICGSSLWERRKWKLDDESLSTPAHFFTVQGAHTPSQNANLHRDAHHLSPFVTSCATDIWIIYASESHAGKMTGASFLCHTHTVSATTVMSLFFCFGAVSCLFHFDSSLAALLPLNSLEYLNRAN